MVSIKHNTLTALLLLFFLPLHAGQLVWEKVAELPRLNGQAHPGLAGCYAGHHQGVLLVAGGANFPDGMPWDGGKKQYFLSS